MVERASVREFRFLADKSKGVRLFRRVSLKGTLPRRPSPALLLGCMEGALEASFALRYTDPDKMVRLAELACQCASRLSTRVYGRELVSDQRARAFAELANAYRVADRMDDARAALSTSFQWLETGKRSAAVEARVLELAAALYRDLRQLGKAERLLESAVANYSLLCDLDGLERALITQSLVANDLGEPERGLEALRRYFSLARGRRLDIPVVHATALNLVDAGCYSEAEAVLDRHGKMYRRAGKLTKLRLYWLQGKIAAGCGKVGPAEALLQVARLGFDHAGQDYDAALVSLDLALLLIEQHRTSELAFILSRMMRTFQAKGVIREAIISLGLLLKACQKRRSTEYLRGQAEAIALLYKEIGARRFHHR